MSDFRSVRSVAVFCGSKPGRDARHLATATSLGHGLAARGMQLVYGGGRIGLMGAVAEAVRGAGGDVIGIIPDFLMKLEVGDTRSTLEVTDSMHTRKRRMFDLADAFVTLAGGLGTLDETVEIITWKQLRLHDKPILILSENGAWDGLSAMIDDFVADGFAAADSAKLFTIVRSVEELFLALESAPTAAQEADSDRL